MFILMFIFMFININIFLALRLMKDDYITMIIIDLQ